MAMAAPSTPRAAVAPPVAPPPAPREERRQARSDFLAAHPHRVDPNRSVARSLDNELKNAAASHIP